MIRRWVIRPDEIAGIAVGLAQTLEERQQALRLVHRTYVERGITISSRAGLKFSPFHILPGTTTFVAKRGNRLLGTLSLIEDSPLGLPMESVHREEITLLRQGQRRFAEVSTLCVASDVRGCGISMLLYQAMFRWARRHRSIEDLVIAVHPKMGPFFRHGLLFESLGPTREYGSLNSALSMPMRIDLTAATARYRARYDRGDMEVDIAGHRTNLYRFFVQDTGPWLQLPEVADVPLVLSCPPPWSEGDVIAYLHACGTDCGSQPRQVRRFIEATWPAAAACTGEPR